MAYYTDVIAISKLKTNIGPSFITKTPGKEKEYKFLIGPNGSQGAYYII